MVICESIYGNTVSVPKEKLIFRPSVYGIIASKGRLLLVTSRGSGKYCFPGGGIDLGETIEDALRREVREETGIEIEIERFFHFKEHFFYYDPLGQAFHSSMAFYLCRPKTTALVRYEDVDDEDAEMPQSGTTYAGSSSCRRCERWSIVWRAWSSQASPTSSLGARQRFDRA